ncbi:hypothetical protein [Carnobacterium maltaromaticum]|uniref:hypothetical protein n=1 Tax=Carnobacterium maltaromaticum TaxID=2751 RepID=UPI0012FB04F6|nr:hypothetical protein [Carnobacterium maltaromaticum]
MAKRVEQLMKNREAFEGTKKLNFFKRRKCNHDYVYLGIDQQYKIYGCLKCGKHRLDY